MREGERWHICGIEGLMAKAGVIGVIVSSHSIVRRK